jgi:hypothetical protein
VESELQLDRVDLVDKVFEGEYEYFGADGSRFVRCDFSRLKIHAFQGFGQFGRCEFIDCSLDRLNLTNVSYIGDTLFERCSFRGTKLTHWYTHQAEFVNCIFEGRFSWIVFSARPSPALPAKRPLNRFDGNDFSSAELRMISFLGGIDLSRQRLPEGPEYLVLQDWPARVRHARSVFDTWPRGPDRNKVEREVRLHEEPYSLMQASYCVGTNLDHSRRSSDSGISMRS